VLAIHFREVSEPSEIDAEGWDRMGLGESESTEQSAVAPQGQNNVASQCQDLFRSALDARRQPFLAVDADQSGTGLLRPLLNLPELQVEVALGAQNETDAPGAPAHPHAVILVSMHPAR
jgi:hypothetical protein